MFLCVMEFRWVVSQLLVVGCVYESWSFSGMWVSLCLCVMEFSWNSSKLLVVRLCLYIIEFFWDVSEFVFMCHGM